MEAGASAAGVEEEVRFSVDRTAPQVQIVSPVPFPRPSEVGPAANYHYAGLGCGSRWGVEGIGRDPAPRRAVAFNAVAQYGLTPATQSSVPPAIIGYIWVRAYIIKILRLENI